MVLRCFLVSDLKARKKKKITGTQGAYTQNRVYASCELKEIFLN